MTHLGNRWKQLNILSALTSLYRYVASDRNLVDWQIGLAAWTVGMLWLRLLGFIRTLNINFATYVTCLLQIVRDISWFLVIMAATMVMFGSMMFIWNVNSEFADLPSRRRGIRRSRRSSGCGRRTLTDFDTPSAPASRPSSDVPDDPRGDAPLLVP